MVKPLPLSAVLNELRVGAVKPLGGERWVSAIDKRCVGGPVEVRRQGLAGDAQADRRHHGGPDKALHHYPAEHYDYWRRYFPEQAHRFVPGGFGENLSTCGLTECNLHIGDVFRVGGALIQISQGRQPCWKLNLRFDVPKMARYVQQTRRTGWYWRVLRTGRMEVGDAMVLVARPEPAWSLDRVLRTLYVNTLDLEALEVLANMRALADGWRNLARRRLARKEVEAWHKRLETPGEASQ